MAGEPEYARVLEKLYSTRMWPEDLESAEGRSRFNEAYKVFSKLISHDWFKSLLEGKSRIKLLDVCGGTGIGGLALAKALIDSGVEVELFVNDLRRSALEKARRYGKQLLGIDVNIVECDAIDIWRLNLVFDAALLYGISAPHFDPYKLVQLVAGVAWTLRPRGLFLVEEFDRIYGLLCRVGCKDLTIDYAGEDRIVLTVGAGYDPLRGMFKRIVLDIPSMNRVPLEYRFWDIAGVAAILWVFFEDVDFIPTDSRLRGIIMARNPRGMSPENYAKPPRIVSK